MTRSDSVIDSPHVGKAGQAIEYRRNRRQLVRGFDAVIGRIRSMFLRSAGSMSHRISDCSGVSRPAHPVLFERSLGAPI